MRALRPLSFFVFELFCANWTMQPVLYKAIVGFQKHRTIANVPQSVWGADCWRYTKSGMKNSDDVTKRCFKKFADEFDVEGE